MDGLLSRPRAAHCSLSACDNLMPHASDTNKLRRNTNSTENWSRGGFRLFSAPVEAGDLKMGNSIGNRLAINSPVTCFTDSLHRIFPVSRADHLVSQKETAPRGSKEDQDT